MQHEAPLSTRTRTGTEFSNAGTIFYGSTGSAVATQGQGFQLPLLVAGGLPDHQSLVGLALRQTLAKRPVLAQCLHSCPSARQLSSR